MGKATAISIGAGLLSAALLLGVMAGSFGAVILAYLAPLPLFYAGLAYGLPGVLIAGAAGTVVSTVMGLMSGVAYLVVFAVPVAILVRQALLWRADAAGTTEWYPPGRLATWLAGIAAAVFLVAALAASGAEGGLPGVLRPGLAQLYAVWAPDADVDAAAARIAELLPAVVAASWMLMMTVNGALAQGLAVRLGANRRPSPDFAGLMLPWFMAPAFGVAALAALVPGAVGFVGVTLAVIAAVPFFLQGLALIHALAQRTPMPGLLVAGTYVVLFVFGGLIVVVAALGVIEQWAGFRRRLSAPGAGREEE